ncbi:hydrolase 1, exosortase A system-associated [Rhodoferax sp.]|uniref:hydrolase 1, exosortase A system-associated n=1 Tax=Rhodoferax sp. TaxID=50421 RepID=UPI00283F7BA9|nr:hydrolase 1, exosortase A system-associated [Rhodoferax sp.]MDR3368479.1 hydrolase 1, exosortase A system-associated [Rhodoferax sp.]
MNFLEQAVVTPCEGESLVGILSQPEQPGTLGMVMVVGGPQYRVGSHRQFVLLARCLANAGFPVLRFDHRGMGDSSGERMLFDNIQEDIGVALDTLLHQCPSVQRVVLWGLCDGASAALLYSGQRTDARLAGLCLLNPWVRSEATLARTHIKHYYTGRLLEGSFWRRLWKGEYEWRPSLSGLWQNLRALRSEPAALEPDSSFQQKMALALRQFPGQVLLLLSACDYTAKEFLECAQSDPAWRGLLQRPTLQRVDVADADHTFSKAIWRAAAEQAVLDWMHQLECTA